MKRSNRLVLLVGVFLAIVAFVGILLLVRRPQRRQRATNRPPTDGPVVVATADIPLSTRIKADQVTTITLPLTSISAGAFADPSQVDRADRPPARRHRRPDHGDDAERRARPGTIIDVQVPVGQRAIAVQVDQVSGVGTVIKTGDYVDVIVGLTEDKFLVDQARRYPDERLDHGRPGPQGRDRQGPPPGHAGARHAAAAGRSAAEAAPAASGARRRPRHDALNGQQEIVDPRGHAQQAEVIKFAQLRRPIRSSPDPALADDFIDPATASR